MVLPDRLPDVLVLVARNVARLTARQDPNEGREIATLWLGLDRLVYDLA